MVFIYNIHTNSHITTQEPIYSQPEEAKIIYQRKLKKLTAPNRKFLISLGFNLVNKKIKKRQRTRKEEQR